MQVELTITPDSPIKQTSPILSTSQESIQIKDSPTHPLIKQCLERLSTEATKYSIKNIQEMIQTLLKSDNVQQPRTGDEIWTVLESSIQIGKLREVGPDGRKQGLFTYEETLKLAMHEGDREILKALEKIPNDRIFEGRIVHNGSKLELSIFQEI